MHVCILQISRIFIKHTTDSIKVVPKQREKGRKRAWRLKIHKPNKILSLGIPIVVICIHKKARFSFKLSRKPVNGNKTSHSRQAFRAHIRPFPFSSGQP